jgi:hypothetical protein
VNLSIHAAQASQRPAKDAAAQGAEPRNLKIFMQSKIEARNSRYSVARRGKNQERAAAPFFAVKSYQTG